MSEDKSAGEKLIASNPNARNRYFLEEFVEAGIVLTGTEIKSMRTQSPNIRDAYVEIRPSGTSLEAWLHNVHIGPYSHGNIWNHEPMRKRKLLLHKHQIQKLFGAVIQKGMTLVATRMYFKKGMAKIEIALGKGKKAHDKREDIKKRSADREISRAMKQSKKDRR